jgi:hypothetical protein
MNTPPFNKSNRHLHVTPSRNLHRAAIALAGLALTGAALGACSSSSPKSTSATAAAVRGNPTTEAIGTGSHPAASVTTAPTASPATRKAPTENSSAASSIVLPVPNNPIVNTATAQTLKIDSVMVENNVDASGKPASDHLEIALTNTGATDAAEIEVFYSFADPTAAAKENYYTRLPAEFTIRAGGTRVVHFDDTSAPDHFPVNKFSLYYTSKNAMDISVNVSAKDAAVQNFDLKRDAGGAEAAD